ncbi:anti-CBASS Acb1 family protein, partial [Acinetobacter baumannii]
YDNINQQQEGRMRTPLHKLLEIVSRSKLGKPLPDSFKFDFASLWQIDDEKKAEIAAKVAEAVTKVEEAGIISRQTALKELRQSSESTGIFSHI